MAFKPKPLSLHNKVQSVSQSVRVSPWVRMGLEHTCVSPPSCWFWHAGFRPENIWLPHLSLCTCLCVPVSLFPAPAPVAAFESYKSGWVLFCFVLSVSTKRSREKMTLNFASCVNSGLKAGEAYWVQKGFQEIAYNFIFKLLRSRVCQWWDLYLSETHGCECNVFYSIPAFYCFVIVVVVVVSLYCCFNCCSYSLWSYTVL